MVCRLSVYIHYVDTLRKYDNYEPKTNRQKQLIVIVFLKYYVKNNKIIPYKGERLRFGSVYIIWLLLKDPVM